MAVPLLYNEYYYDIRFHIPQGCDALCNLQESEVYEKN
jgi:hypothetical protein